MSPSNQKIAAEVFEFGLSAKRHMNSSEFLALPSVKKVLEMVKKHDTGKKNPMDIFTSSNYTGYDFYWHANVDHAMNSIIKVAKVLAPDDCLSS